MNAEKFGGMDLSAKGAEDWSGKLLPPSTPRGFTKKSLSELLSKLDAQPYDHCRFADDPYAIEHRRLVDEERETQIQRAREVCEVQGLWLP